MAIRRRKKPSLVLPLSSMGDIAFLLIIFFMLASNFMKTNKVELEKPASPDLEQQEPADRIVHETAFAHLGRDGVSAAHAEVLELAGEAGGDGREQADRAAPALAERL